MKIKTYLKGTVSALPIIAIACCVAVGSVIANKYTTEVSVTSEHIDHGISRPRKTNLKPHRVSVQDVRCLATNIYHEARNQTEQGMMGVAFVTINRTKTEGFPASVCDVVYERTKNLCQFSWVCEKGKKVVNNNSFEQAMAVAKRVLYAYNHTADPTHGALFYHATYVNPRWKNLTKTTQIQDHIFYK